MSDLSEHDKAVLNCVFNPNLPLSEVNLQESQLVEDTEENTPETEKTKKLEIQAINLAESGKLDDALAILNRALEIAPNRASIYNNRAHVYQFQRKFTEAFDDLTKAILLAQSTQKRTLSQAHCQRGLLHKRASRLELAREDFEIAARLGNHFAKSQLVELNPYAALCNQMLRKVMDSL